MRGFIVIIAAVLVAAPLAAQGREPVGLRASAITEADPRWTPSFSSAAVPETEWKKGMIIGGVVGVGLGVLSYATFHNLCESDCGFHPIQAAGFLAICSLLGGLIGSLFPKQ